MNKILVISMLVCIPLNKMDKYEIRSHMHKELYTQIIANVFNLCEKKVSASNRSFSIHGCKGSNTCFRCYFGISLCFILAGSIYSYVVFSRVFPITFSYKKSKRSFRSSTDMALSTSPSFDTLFGPLTY